jgi:succinate dehydrogenase assembly factor 2
MPRINFLFSTFFAKFGDTLTEEQLSTYDLLINEPNNDWLIYNWVVKKDEVPERYQGDVMRLLQEHAANTAKEKRYQLPDL